MSDPISIQTQPAKGAHPSSDPRAAIAEASRKTGVDFDYLLAQARLESGLDPAAKARTSSATGLYQFIDSTWLETLDRHGEALGFSEAAAAIQPRGGRMRVADNADRNQIMALRFDPNASALMAGALAGDNRATLTGVLGREPDAAELYMAHFLGAGGASKFLGQLQSDPAVSAAAILPAPAASNRAIFYQPGGAERSVGGVMDLMRGKMTRAMAQDDGVPVSLAGPMQATSFNPPADGPGEGSSSFALPAVPSFTRFAPRRAASLPFEPMPDIPRQSMADTLRSSFALAGDAMSPRARDSVQTAYQRLRAFDL